MMIYSHAPTRTDVHTYAHLPRVHAPMHTHASTNVRTCVQTYALARRHTHTHRSTHALKRTQTHAHECTRSVTVSVK